jgi:hypothetical protein
MCCGVGSRCLSCHDHDGNEDVCRALLRTKDDRQQTGTAQIMSLGMQLFLLVVGIVVGSTYGIIT